MGRQGSPCFDEQSQIVLRASRLVDACNRSRPERPLTCTGIGMATATLGPPPKATHNARVCCKPILIPREEKASTYTNPETTRDTV
jgi:hypothetical protein